MRDDTLEAALLEGDEDLEVVGESYRQAELWRVVGQPPSPEARIRMDVYAMLLAEDGNPHDPNAVSVWISGLMVGYLPRDHAGRPWHIPLPRQRSQARSSRGLAKASGQLPRQAGT
jgi:hypothetical protein